MKIAFLGLGKMGAAMAGHLIASGHEVTLWNRDRTKAASLAEAGARVAETPAEAARDREVILTMLFDDAANEEVLLGPQGAICALPSGSLHVACSTISVSLSKRLAAAHAEKAQRYVAAPVFGRPNVAADGKLWIVAAGQDDAIAKARPLLETFSRGISVVGREPSQAHAVKLAGNFMIASMIQTLGEAMAFASGQGIAPEALSAAVNSALFQSPFYESYAKVMLNPPEKPGATIHLGAKDVRLFREAGGAAGFDSGLAAYLAAELDHAIAARLADADWPSSIYGQVLQKSRAR